MKKLLDKISKGGGGFRFSVKSFEHGQLGVALAFPPLLFWASSTHFDVRVGKFTTTKPTCYVSIYIHIFRFRSYLGIHVGRMLVAN